MADSGATMVCGVHIWSCCALLNSIDPSGSRPPASCAFIHLAMPSALHWMAPAGS